MGKFWQSLATFGSGWNENRGGFIYRLGKSCHVWPKMCHDFFCNGQILKTTKIVSRFGQKCVTILL